MFLITFSAILTFVVSYEIPKSDKNGHHRWVLMSKWSKSCVRKILLATSFFVLSREREAILYVAGKVIFSQIYKVEK